MRCAAHVSRGMDKRQTALATAAKVKSALEAMEYFDGTSATKTVRDEVIKLAEAVMEMLEDD